MVWKGFEESSFFNQTSITFNGSVFFIRFIQQFLSFFFVTLKGENFKKIIRIIKLNVTNK